MGNTQSHATEPEQELAWPHSGHALTGETYDAIKVAVEKADDGYQKLMQGRVRIDAAFGLPFYGLRADPKLDTEKSWTLCRSASPLRLMFHAREEDAQIIASQGLEAYRRQSYPSSSSMLLYQVPNEAASRAGGMLCIAEVTLKKTRTIQPDEESEALYQLSPSDCSVKVQKKVPYFQVVNLAPEGARYWVHLSRINVKYIAKYSYEGGFRLGLIPIKIA